MTKVVNISYEDLLSSDDAGNEELALNLRRKIGQAFGNSDSFGILTISGVPKFTKIRSTLLPLAREIALLPSDALNDITIESSNYQVGWSHGKERVEGKDNFDDAKGSFYANPLTDNLVQEILERDKVTNDDDDRSTEENLKKIAKENPAFFAPNVWPSDTLPELEVNFKEMGKLICSVGKKVAKLCDSYVLEQYSGYTPGKLEAIITKSKCCKGRLLHYFALEQDEHSAPNTEYENGPSKYELNDSDISSWCGWHNDHGSLTGLIPAMYLDLHGNEVECPDESAGLYIKSRNGDLKHVQLPINSIAFQIGETAQIHTGGILQATPHAVRGCSGIGGKSSVVSRESFAVFMEPEYHDAINIPSGKTLDETQKREAEIHLPKTVLSLRSRWKPEMNFGEFSNATFAAFY